MAQVIFQGAKPGRPDPFTGVGNAFSRAFDDQSSLLQERERNLPMAQRLAEVVMENFGPSVEPGPGEMGPMQPRQPAGLTGIQQVLGGMSREDLVELIVSNGDAFASPDALNSIFSGGKLPDVKGVPRDVWNTLDRDEQKKVLGLIDKENTQVVNFRTPDGNQATALIDSKTGEVVRTLGVGPTSAGEKKPAAFADFLWPILQKVQAGQEITREEQKALDIYSQADPLKAVVRDAVGSQALPGAAAEAAGGAGGAYVEGQVYTDAAGNKARYENGQWVPVP